MTHKLTNNVLAFYWKHAARYPKLVAGLAIMLPITSFVNTILPPLILANILNDLSRHNYHKGRLISEYGSRILLYAVVDLLGGIATWRIVDAFVYRLEGRVLRDLAQQVFDKMISQTADFHANNFAGSLVSQYSKLMGSYIRIADSTIFQVSQLVFGVLFTALILFKRAPLYVIALLIVSAFFMTTTAIFSKRVRKISARHSELESNQTGLLADAIGNVMVIKSFAQGNAERRRFAQATEKTNSNLLQLMRAHRNQLNYFNLVTSIMAVVALIFAVISVVEYGSNIATVFLIFNYTAFVVNQLFQFSNSSLKAFNRAIGDAKDMVDNLAEAPHVLDPAQPENIAIKSGSIQFKDVTFKHDGANTQIFDSFNVRIKHAEKVGLVGHSGSGKTTFTRILLRFSDIQGGEIKIDGQNIANITQDDLHHNVAYVPQEPLLFHRSILENIGYGKPGATFKEIKKAADQAHASEFIDKLPLKYETLVGERGVKLSGGQRQRIAIARAMLKDAPVLVLDEATSALDSESELLIQKALARLMAGRTTIVIAHRLSTIQKMDRIIVLDNGKIVEQGSHKELIKHEGLYAKLWAHQSGGFIDE